MPSASVPDSSPMNVLILRLDDQRYGLPLHVVERVIAAVEITPLPGAPAVVHGIIDMHGRVVPVMNLRLRVGRPERPNSPDQQFVIVRERPDRLVALVADGTVGVLEIEPGAAVPGKSVQANLPLVQGILQTPEGLIVIHDVSRFLASSEAAALDRALLEHQAQRA